jgi:hypothetical protein
MCSEGKNSQRLYFILSLVTIFLIGCSQFNKPKISPGLYHTSLVVNNELLNGGEKWLSISENNAFIRLGECTLRFDILQLQSGFASVYYPPTTEILTFKELVSRNRSKYPNTSDILILKSMMRKYGLDNNLESISRIDPYDGLTMFDRFKKKNGLHFFWKKTVTIPVKSKEYPGKVYLSGKSIVFKSDNGTFHIVLHKIE